MSGFLLDSNILSDVIRHPNGAGARAIARVGAAQISTSIVVAAELRFAAAKAASTRITDRLEAALSALQVHAFQSPADKIYGRIRAQLEEEGRSIGANDLLIAAHALALGCTLATANEREFARVPGLEIVNWLR